LSLRAAASCSTFASMCPRVGALNLKRCHAGGSPRGMGWL
jgi:hypothetical protein